MGLRVLPRKDYAAIGDVLRDHAPREAARLA